MKHVTTSIVLLALSISSANIAVAQACLGVNLFSLEEVKANGCDKWEYAGVEGGVAVLIVAEGSPAARAGLEAGDVLLSFNWIPTTKPRDVVEAVSSLAPGQLFAATLYRKEELIQVSGVLGTVVSRGCTVAMPDNALQRTPDPDTAPAGARTASASSTAQPGR